MQLPEIDFRALPTIEDHNSTSGSHKLSLGVAENVVWSTLFGQPECRVLRTGTRR